MLIEVYTRCYNIYGGHPSLGYIGDFLIGRDSNFGPSVEEVQITFHFRTSGPPKKTLEGTYEQFHANMASLPKVTFRRKKQQLDVQVASAMIDGTDWRAQRDVRIELFHEGVLEVISAIKLCRQKINNRDEFEIERLLDACQNRLKYLPETQEELVSLVETWKAERQNQHEALSPWEKLGIDWDEYHPASRELLDDVFYWNCSNNFAPHGNDTGADLLADYAEKHRRKPAKSAASYFQALARSWGYESLSAMDGSSLNELRVGLAFAELKVNGLLHTDSHAEALVGLSLQHEEAAAAKEWPERNERIKTLAMLKNKLNQLANKAVDRTL